MPDVASLGHQEYDLADAHDNHLEGEGCPYVPILALDCVTADIMSAIL